jgi:hypothetical protein
MATKQTFPTSRTTQLHRRSKVQHFETAHSNQMPNDLDEAIEDARATLGKAVSIIRCLTISLDAETKLYDGPYYPDISEIALKLVRKAFNDLDSVNLRDILRGRTRGRRTAPKSRRPVASSAGLHLRKDS